MRLDAVRRALDAELAAARERLAGADPRVLDVGGGSGTLAVPLAAAGCTVTVVDPSPNALATLARRAEEAGVSERIIAVQGDADALSVLVPSGEADLVLAHGLLEVVEDPKNAMTALADALAPDGAVSVLVANRFAAVLHRALAGRLSDARDLLDDPAGRLPGEALLRRYDTDSLRRMLSDAGLAVELVQGSGVLRDLVPGSVLEGNPALLADLESRAARTAPLRDLAKRLHAIARRAA